MLDKKSNLENAISGIQNIFDQMKGHSWVDFLNFDPLSSIEDDMYGILRSAFLAYGVRNKLPYYALDERVYKKDVSYTKKLQMIKDLTQYCLFSEKNVDAEYNLYVGEKTAIFTKTTTSTINIFVISNDKKVMESFLQTGESGFIRS